MGEPVPSNEAMREDDDEINLLDLIIVVAKHKKIILGLPLAAAVIAALFSLLLPNIYTATAKILPPQQTQSTSAVLSQLSSLTGLATGSASGIKNPNDLYIGMLKSRTVADNLIKRFDLNTLYEQKYQSNTRKQLAKITALNSGKDGIITIEVEDKNPQHAADLANAYVEELYKLTTVLVVTEASQRRLFFERQLQQAKDNLAKSEVTTRQALEKGGLLQVEGQGRAMVESSARLRGLITVKEVEISAMRNFAAERNPDLLRAQQELDAMKRELAKIEGTFDGKLEGSQKTGAQGIENLSLLRDMKYNETVYELLVKQYEIAKIDEAKDSALIQVMDKAIEPDLKSKPKRGVIVILTALAAGLLAVFWVFIKEAGLKMRRNPAQAARLDLIRNYLIGK
jgi:tyrosine-protein kinase Etk/Wzc